MLPVCVAVVVVLSMFLIIIMIVMNCHACDLNFPRNDMFGKNLILVL